MPSVHRTWTLMFMMGLLMIAMVFALVACSGEPLTTREQDTLVGTGVGAGGGALIGAAVGHPAAGALVGGAAGGVTGYAVGNHEQNEEDRRYYDGY